MTTTLPDLSSLKVKGVSNAAISKPIEPPIIQNYVEPIDDNIVNEAAEVIEKISC